MKNAGVTRTGLAVVELDGLDELGERFPDAFAEWERCPPRRVNDARAMRFFVSELPGARARDRWPRQVWERISLRCELTFDAVVGPRSMPEAKAKDDLERGRGIFGPLLDALAPVGAPNYQRVLWWDFRRNLWLWYTTRIYPRGDYLLLPRADAEVRRVVEDGFGGWKVELA